MTSFIGADMGFHSNASLRRRAQRIGARALLAASLAMVLGGSTMAHGSNQPLYVNPDSTVVRAAKGLTGQAEQDARLIARFPTGTWLTSGTPEQVQAEAHKLVGDAAAKGAIPVLVAYNIPFRDCALYSAGGAADSAAYAAWVRGLAAGIGSGRAIVILEPDGLGVIPWNTTLNGQPESCRPAGMDAKATVERYRQLRDAAAVLSALPGVQLYMDGGGSSWLAPGEIAARLLMADAGKARGFFLNVSNYESDTRLKRYARWVSDCMALVSQGGLSPRECPGTPITGARDYPGAWADVDAAYDTLFWRLHLKRDPQAQKHAVLDTSRNGQGGWVPKPGHYRDAEVWCNPPERGLGRRPTLASDDPYIDAFLWIKIPGESDGQCYRGTAGPGDPERGMVAPAAGAWFAQQARELITLARPGVE
ncbi:MULTISPECIES: glycoside hydrolase family 6 protein [unclassified Novosphingobium]|uniref:glycoside hydrolase family 6 protein n=1 Tax=unclassified Novosphingobium TaxID=2644732 RepID=UPI0003B47F88|nr:MULTISPECIES: glycoside hydrolase family 6 protein [unclassified Novosphingobium]